MKPISLDEFTRLKFISNIEFSPEYSAACFCVTAADVKSNSYRRNLYIRKNGTVRQLTSGGKEGAFFWLDSDTVVFPADRDASKEPSLASKFYKISISGGEAVPFLTLPIPTEKLIPLSNGDFIAVCSVFPGYEELYKGDEKLAKKYLAAQKDGEDYEIVTQYPWWWNGGTFHHNSYSALYYYSSGKKALSQLTPKGMSVSDVKVDKAGEKVYYSMLDMTVPSPKYFAGETVYCTELSSGETKTVASSNEAFMIGTYFLCDSKMILAASDLHCGICSPSDFYTLDYSTGNISLYARINKDIGSTVGSDVRYGGGECARVIGDTLYFTCTSYDNCNLLKLENGEINTVMAGKGSVDCFDITPDGHVLACALYGMRPQELYNENCRCLSSFNTRACAGKYIAEPEILNFERAGQEIHGFVLKPFGFEKGKKYPVIIDIHGGPRTVYGPVYYHEMQYWAGLGYFVIFCNPTGSDGRGDFMDICGKYGTVDYDDLMAFCDTALEAYPEMDKANFFETGGSYGGFMTNWIIGHTDRFRACASQRSISNWTSFCGVSDIGYDFGEDQNAADIWTNHDKLWWHSPLKYADRVKTPTLFIHSFEDYRCPIDQGYQMYSALVRNGAEARLVCFKGENHELSRSGKPKHRLKRLSEITEWFETHRDK